MSEDEKKAMENFMDRAMAHGGDRSWMKVTADLAMQVYKRNYPKLRETISDTEAQEALMTIFRDSLKKLMRGRFIENADHDDGPDTGKPSDQQSSYSRYHGQENDLAAYLADH